MREVRCQHCGTVLSVVKGGKLKIHCRSRLVAVSLATGEVEVNCHHCRRSTRLPLRLQSDT